MVTYSQIIKNMNIGEFVSNYRKKSNLTQEDFANKAGLSRSYITRLEKGDFVEDEQISLATFIRLSKALDVPMYEFFQEIKFLNPDKLPPLGSYLNAARNNKNKSKIK